MTVLFVLCSSRDLSFVMFGFENQSVAKCRGSWVVGRGRGSRVWVVGRGCGCG